jgi:hypothetical protein
MTLRDIKKRTPKRGLRVQGGTRRLQERERRRSRDVRRMCLKPSNASLQREAIPAILKRSTRATIHQSREIRTRSGNAVREREQGQQVTLETPTYASPSGRSCHLRGTSGSRTCRPATKNDGDQAVIGDAQTAQTFNDIDIQASGSTGNCYRINTGTRARAGCRIPSGRSSAA